MAQAIISRRGGGSGYATITFNGGHALNRSNATSLYGNVGDLAATNIWHHSMYINLKNFALFGGGTTNGTNYSSRVCSYNYSLVYVNLSSLSQARRGLVATTLGSYALFGGGYNGSYLSTVDAYNTSLTRSTPTSLDTSRYALAATGIGSYALFAGGGRDNVEFDVVDAYNTVLTRSTPTSLGMSRAFLAATTVNGDYALFGGGKDIQGSQYNRANVDAYDSNLTRTNPSYLSVARYNLAATELGSYALFGGGYNGSYSLTVVDAYNKNLTRSTELDFTYSKQQLAATTVGNYALFGGGFIQTVDAYKINRKVPVYPGTKYKLGSMSSESTSSTMQEIETTAPITGYIKIKDATIN